MDTWHVSQGVYGEGTSSVPRKLTPTLIGSTPSIRARGCLAELTLDRCIVGVDTKIISLASVGFWFAAVGKWFSRDRHSSSVQQDRVCRGRAPPIGNVEYMEPDSVEDLAPTDEHHGH